MKVLLMSDIHANAEALTEVLNNASYDEILFAGDVVDYGPNPFDAWVLLRYVKAKSVLGNHDAAAVFGIDCRSSKSTHAAAVLTRKLITIPGMPEKTLESLGKTNRKMDVDCDGLKVRLIHAAPDDALYRYMTKDEAATLDVKGADLLVVGHTHLPYEVKTDRVWVVNPGSVGMPKDGNPKASYAILDTDKREVRFERAGYDTETMLSSLSGALAAEKPTFEFLAQIFRTGNVPGVALS